MWYAVNAWRIGSCSSVGTGSYSIKTENNVNRYGKKLSWKFNEFMKISYIWHENHPSMKGA